MIKPAIAQLAEEILAIYYAKPGTSSWALLQAKSLGMSFLKKVERLGLTEPEEIEKLRKSTRLEVMQVSADPEAGVKPTDQSLSGNGGVDPIS